MGWRSAPEKEGNKIETEKRDPFYPKQTRSSVDATVLSRAPRGSHRPMCLCRTQFVCPFSRLLSVPVTGQQSIGRWCAAEFLGSLAACIELDAWRV